MFFVERTKWRWRDWDLEAIRSQFPALRRKQTGQPVAYFDGPAGSQVPSRVAEAVSRYLLTTNANHEGPFATSRESDALLEEAHQAAADFVGTADRRLRRASAPI